MYGRFYPHNRFYYHVPYRNCYGYRCIPYPYNYYGNFINSNYAAVDQNIFNSGIMDDVIQQSIISQAEPDHPQKMIEPSVVLEYVPPEAQV